jgi:hypothetical protein
LRFYLEDDERRYGAEHEGEGVPFEYTGAWLLGTDGRPFVSAQVARAVGSVLDRFTDSDAEAVGMVIRESGRLAIDDAARTEVFEQFQWYRRGIGL